MDVPVLHIELDEAGVPRTINRRVKVKMIAQMHLVAGESVEQIAEHYGLTVAEVYAALAYYYDNRLYFEQQAAELQPLLDAAQRQSAELKARLLQRMQQRNKPE